MGQIRRHAVRQNQAAELATLQYLLPSSLHKKTGFAGIKAEEVRLPLADLLVPKKNWLARLEEWLLAAEMY